MIVGHFPLDLIIEERDAKPCCNLEKLAGMDSKGEELWNSASALKNLLQKKIYS